MKKYIEADKLIVEIERLGRNWDEVQELQPASLFQADLYELLSIINSLQQEQLEYGCLSTMYICGKKPIWNVGDILAHYKCTSNEEGEFIIGKVNKVRFDKEVEEWIYIFENNDEYFEEELLENAVYKKF